MVTRYHINKKLGVATICGDTHIPTIVGWLIVALNSKGEYLTCTSPNVPWSYTWLNSGCYKTPIGKLLYTCCRVTMSILTESRVYD